MTYLIASNIVLWIAVLGLTVVMLGLMRQVGLLHERSSPMGAMITDHGPDIGDKAPEFELPDYFGRSARLGGVAADDHGHLDADVQRLGPSEDHDLLGAVELRDVQAQFAPLAAQVEGDVPGHPGARLMRGVHAPDVRAAPDQHPLHSGKITDRVKKLVRRKSGILAQ